MRATDPATTFMFVLIIGIGVGIVFDLLARQSRLAHQFSGSTRGIVISALVGVAGAFGGYAVLLLMLGGGLVTSVVGAAAGAFSVLFAWRLAK